MPSGKVHDIINTTVFGLGGVIYWVLYANHLVEIPQAHGLAFSASYAIGTFMITPDLDLAEQRQVRPKQRWGKLGCIWHPYGRLFKHRGLSHTWVIGPLTRLIYLSLIVAIVFIPLGAIGKRLGIYVYIPMPSDDWQGLLGYMLGGYYLSQWLHLVADGIAPLGYRISYWKMKAPQKPPQKAKLRKR